MNFPLQKLELHIEEIALLEGEKLFESDQFGQLYEVERHLWMAQVGTYEAEVQISPSKVLAASCDCGTFAQNKMCGHVVAVLLAVRKKAQEKKLQKQQKKAPTRKSKKLTTSIILNHIQHEELVDFVRQYAKTNRNFAITFKARFAGLVSSIDNEEKYNQLLEAAIGSARKPDRNISHRGGREIEKVLNQLLDQARDKIALEHYSEAFTMCKSIIEKIPPILKKLITAPENLESTVKAAFALIDDLLDQNPAPSLQEEIWNYCLDKSLKIVHRNSHFDLLFFKLMYKLTNEPNRFNQLTFLLDTQIRQYQQEEKNPAELLILKLDILESTGQENAIRELSESLTREGMLFYAINHAFEKGQFDRVKKLAAYGLKSSGLRSMHNKIEEILYQVALLEKDKKLIYRYGLKRLLSTSDVQYFKQLKQYRGAIGKHRKQVKELIQTIREMPFSIARLKLQAAIFAEEQSYAALIELIRDHRSIDLLKLYTAFLLSADKKTLYQLYRDLLKDYLTHHLGRKPSQKVRILISHLLQFGAQDLAESLVEEFRSQYPERHSLIEELEMF